MSSQLIAVLYVNVCVCARECMCVCVKERERERECVRGQLILVLYIHAICTYV